MTSATTNGAVAGDIDNDGDLDIYVTGIATSQNYLYINDGAGYFREEAIARGADVPAGHVRQGFSAALGDMDRDGFLDIYTTEWNPRQVEPVSRLLRNRGSAAPGSFVDVTESAGVSLAGTVGQGRNGPLTGVFAFSPRWSDFDRDGWPDLAIAGDFGTSRLFWNNGDGSFTEGSQLAGVGSDENGMGATIGDYDGDGDLDWFVTSIYDPSDACAGGGCNWSSSGNRLYRNEGGRQFSDQTDAAGVRNGGWGWGTTFLDYDNDGDLDLVMTNGVDFVPGSIDEPFNDDPMRLWRNDGAGQFEEVAATEGLTDVGSGKGLLKFDYDRDGDLDLFVVNNASQPVLYRNDADNGNDWLTIKTVGTLSNRDGVGAMIMVDPDLNISGDELVRDLQAGSNYLSQDELLVHFGLGSASDETIDYVRVQWPSGVVQEFTDVDTNQFWTVTEAVPEPSGVGSFFLFGMALICYYRSRSVR